MTLILGMANRHHTILVADRRATSNGRVVDDELSKSAVLFCQDSRVAVAFTGLARASMFETEPWLLEALGEEAPPDYLTEPLIERFRRRASRDFAKVRVPHFSDKRLAVVFAGYHYGPPLRMFHCTVHNLLKDGGAADEFAIKHEDPPRGTHNYMVAAGAWHNVLPTSAVEELRPLVDEGRPAIAVVGKAVEVIRLVADSPQSGGLIGKQCMSIVLPSDRSRPAVGGYHSTRPTDSMYLPAYVNASGPEQGMSMRGFRFKAGLPNQVGPSIIVPKVGRNAPCPCGSGKKYKKCHGRPIRDGDGIRIGSLAGDASRTGRSRSSRTSSPTSNARG